MFPFKYVSVHGVSVQVVSVQKFPFRHGMVKLYNIISSVRKNAGLGKNQRDTGSCLFSRCGIRDSERDSAGLFKNPFMTCKISVYSSDESKKGQNIKLFFNLMSRIHFLSFLRNYILSTIDIIFLFNPKCFTIKRIEKLLLILRICL